VGLVKDWGVRGVEKEEKLSSGGYKPVERTGGKKLAGKKEIADTCDYICLGLGWGGEINQ